jgi:DMSO/TMAO reductase YedYZ molybdopterin-dependent catalytic subunit
LASRSAALLGPRFSRRDFLAAAFLLPAARTLPDAIGFQGSGGARLLGAVPLGNPIGRAPTPLGPLLGTGLSARQFFELASLNRDSVSQPVPTDRFFVRTAAPSALPSPVDARGWTIEVAGLVREPSRLTFASLEPKVARGGRYLLECSGNSDPANYGLLSTADWDGVPLTALLETIGPSTPAWRVLVSGLDDPADPGRTSVPGASWIFSRDDLQRAVLATRMNGEPLPRHHGAPVRLIVPGWYGCACIKWVNRIELVADDAQATTQMREFAARTHQNGSPALAREYLPAAIDTAAMPIRVEKWTSAGTTFYRVIGILWGGAKPTNALSIRFHTNLPWTKVDDCPMPQSSDTWSLWTHTWRPDAPGRYTIVLRVDDPSIRTRRLDVFFYAREIRIDEM